MTPLYLILGALTAFLVTDGPRLWQSWLNYRLKRLELKKAETSTLPPP